MHGRVHRDNKSCRSLGRSCSQHMRSVFSLATTDNAAVLACDSRTHRDSSFITSRSTDSFIKDGRKIRVGDCALFKPPKDSPPFIGLIRWLTWNKENNLQLGVNLLYRSSELKLGKGTLLDSAPNEIFYSFLKDEVPAASLLHPCKVAFLPKGVELPIGTSSFICWRAYDIANKSLWWLTDKQFINQEEVDQLLYTTRSEMHQSLQPGTRSPKQSNSPSSTSQLKASSDNGQNSGNAPSQGKGKKRERGDHSSQPTKRGGRSTLPDDGDSVPSKTESDLKHEIVKITEKAGVVDFDGVEKLVQLMQLDTKPEKNLDLGSRSMLANVLASTDKVDCLCRFVHLRGLPVLDSWLQDIHRRKIGEGDIIKDGDKSVEEFLLILLRALVKIPVNLQALQTCNIGRSVNHLRSHKNMEIQRKARTLVDTWKKRVEAEMISIDVQSGSTQAGSSRPSKSRLPEASHGGSRTPDGAMKSSLTQNSSAKTSSGRSSPGESGNKCVSSSPGTVKQAPTIGSGKGSQLKISGGGTVDSPQIREDRSSSSNQSHNNDQSLSLKNDIKSFASLSVTVNKTSSTSTRSRKNSDFSGELASTVQKEPSSSRNYPVNKNTALEKSSHSAITCERVAEEPISEGISNNLIVKIPNPAKNSAQGVCGDFMEDPIIMSSPASPLQKHKQYDPSSKNKGEVSDVNYNQKHSFTGPEDAVSPAVLPEDEQSVATDGYKRLNEVPASDNLKSVKLNASSFSPMNALVESCAKCSEATSSLSLDDVGMNLLASVAAGEISRSDDFSPYDSAERMTHAGEEVCSGIETKSNSSPKDYPVGDAKKQAILNSCSSDVFFSGSKDIDFSQMELRRNTELKGGIDGMVNEEQASTIHLDSGECKLMVSDAASKALEESKRSRSHNEGLNMASISLPKKTSTFVEPLFAEKDSNKDLGQPECGQKSVPEAGGSVKVGELCEKDAKGYMGKSERLESGKDVGKNGGIQSRAFPCSASHDLNGHCETNLENQEISEHSIPASQCLGSVKQESQKDELREKRSTSIHTGNTGKSTSACTVSASSAHSGGTDPCEKMKFDLNEDFSDDVKYEESANLPSTVQMVNSSPSPVNFIPVGHSASITIASAAKGTFFPPDDLLRSKVELRWKGSAATIAFRSTEPKKVVEMVVGTSNLCLADASTSKDDRTPLDIDLNVPDERLVEEMAFRNSALAFESTSSASKCGLLLNESPGYMHRSFGGLDLDLNIADEANDNVQCSTSSHHHLETSLAHIKPVTNLHIQRNFDLNDGPRADDASVMQFPVSQLVKGSVATQVPSTGFTMCNQGMGSFSSWYSPGNTYSPVAIPSLLPNRREQSFSIFPPGAPQRSFGPGGVAQFNSDMYSGSVLSSSPAVPFPSGPFQYPVFPFDATFPRPSSTFSVGGTLYQDSSSNAIPPSIYSQYLGPVGNVAPQFQRPFVVGLADVHNNGVVDSNRRWGRQGLDLNAGPGTAEGEPKEEMLPYSSGQQSVSSFLVLAEEQARNVSVSGGILKTMEPDGGCRSEPNRDRHSSWQ